ncbi:UNVERIFIED_CONTAM: hypothetical protein K2H54_030881 [Gekko kuhli]
MNSAQYVSKKSNVAFHAIPTLGQLLRILPYLFCVNTTPTYCFQGCNRRETLMYVGLNICKTWMSKPEHLLHPDNKQLVILVHWLICCLLEVFDLVAQLLVDRMLPTRMRRLSTHEEGDFLDF